MDILEQLSEIERLAQSPEFGWSGDDPVLDFGADDLFYPGEGDIERNWDGKSAKSPSGTTFALRIDNQNVGAQTVELFGFEGQDYYDNVKPADVLITASTGYGSYLMLLQYLKNNPFEIVGARFSSTEAQLNQLSYTWNQKDPWGKSDSNVISASTFRTEKDFLSGIISLPIRHIVDITTYVELPLLASTILDITFFIGIRRVLSQKIERQPSPPILPGKAGRIQIPSRVKPSRRINIAGSGNII